MAVMIPSHIPGKATLGEKKLFRTLEEYLPSNVLVYYEAMIQGRKADFILIIPNMGVLVLEVKDYKKNSIKQMSSDKWVVNGIGSSTREIKNPLDQAREYAFLLSDKLRENPLLLNDKGNLLYPYGFGVVLTNISRGDAITLGIEDIIPSNLLLTSSDIDPNNEEFDELSLINSLQSMFRFIPKESMSEETVHGIRYALFPEIRLESVRKYDEKNLLKLRSLKAMSVYQESLARQTGEGHRMIRGVAGSGKTLVMTARAKILAQENPDWKILIVCYGVVLSRTIKSTIGEAEEYKGIEVMTFHEFLYNKFKIYDDSHVEGFINTSEMLKPKFPVYEAILIDEGQDFDSTWLRLLHMCLNPETSSFLLAEDRAQDIFRKGRSLSKEVGLNFRGRSRVLTVNYRNTRNVLQFSWNFYKKFGGELIKGEEVIEPRTTDRRGLNPVVKKFSNIDEEISWISQEIETLKQRGTSLKDIAVLYRVRKFKSVDYLDKLSSSLKGLGISYDLTCKDRDSKYSFNYQTESVKVLTLDSSRGLNFEVVFVMNVDNVPFVMSQDVEREASLLYIGMTRSTDVLYLTYSAKSEFTEYFDEVSSKRV